MRPPTCARASVDIEGMTPLQHHGRHAALMETICWPGLGWGVRTLIIHGTTMSLCLLRGTIQRHVYE